MKKYQYCFLMMAIFVSPHSSKAVNLTVACLFAGVGLYQALRNK